MNNDIDFLNTLSNILLGIVALCLLISPFIGRQIFVSIKRWRVSKKELDEADENYWKNKNNK